LSRLSKDSSRPEMSIMPNPHKLKQVLKRSEKVKKQRFINELTGNSSHLEGILHINEVKHTELQRPQNKTNRVQEYVDHFSHIADFVGKAKVEGV